MTLLLAAARAVGVEVAAKHAGDVDVRARFPREAFAALKKQKLLGIMVPKSEGGPGRASPKWFRSATRSANIAPRRR